MGLDKGKSLGGGEFLRETGISSSIYEKYGVVGD